MTAGLSVAPGVTLPPEIVVSKLAILATSGAGKSNAAVVLAEAMYDAGYPWVAIDPKGDWWGVRAASDGQGAGLPVPVLGGDHGDIPLEPTSGALIARLVAGRRLTCVLDVSDLGRQEMFRFLADFAETLLKVNREPLHLFAEECDDYLPQMAREKGQLPRCLGAWQRLIKRGRHRGIGSTLISQRSAAVNKDALNMTDTLVAMRTTAPLDRKAILGWVEAHSADRQLVDTLPGLEDGEAWLWSPQRLRCTDRIQFRRRRTFDSGATPLLGATAARAATLTPVDLDELAAEMADTIERAQADDPARLRVRIRELERDLARAIADRPAPVEVVREVTVAAVPDGMRKAVHRAIVAADDALQVLSDARERLAEAGEVAAALPSPAAAAPVVPATAAAAPVPRPRPAPAPASDDDGGRLSKAERSVLTVLVLAPGPVESDRVARLAGYAPDTGGINNALSSLRTRGLLERGNPLVVTDSGRAAVADVLADLPTGSALLEHWKGQGKLINGKAGRRVLEELARFYPNSLPTDELATLAGYTPGTGGINNALSRLRVLGLIENCPGGVILSADLTDQGAA